MSDEARAQVGVGCHVVVELIDERGGRETLAFDLVQEQAADFSRGLVSVSSPLGAAVRGKFAGDEVAYRMGDICSVRITPRGPGAAGHRHGRRGAPTASSGRGAPQGGTHERGYVRVVLQR